MEKEGLAAHWVANGTGDSPLDAWRIILSILESLQSCSDNR